MLTRAGGAGGPVPRRGMTHFPVGCGVGSGSRWCSRCFSARLAPLPKRRRSLPRRSVASARCSRRARASSSTRSSSRSTSSPASRPRRITNQQPLYVDVMPKRRPAAAGRPRPLLQADDVRRDARRRRPQYSPRPGVQVFRDARVRHGAHLRRHARGRDVRRRLRDRRGAAVRDGRPAPRRQGHARRADRSRRRRDGPRAAHRPELHRRRAARAVRRRCRSRFGAAGARGQQDVLDYIAGINARIDDVRARPDEAARRVRRRSTSRRADWDVSDTVAMAVLLVTQFTVSNGGEERNAQMRLEFRKRFGKHVARALRRLPQRATTRRRSRSPRARHRSDRPGKRRAAASTSCPTSARSSRYNPQTAGPGRRRRRRDGAVGASVVNRSSGAIPRPRLERACSSARATRRPAGRCGPPGRRSPTSRRRSSSSTSCTAAASTSTGVTFPGASPWPLIGHGIDFAWSGTSANGDNQDTFVETLCNPDGSPADRRRAAATSTRASARRSSSATCSVTTPPPSAGNMSPQQRDRLPPAALRARAGVRVRDRRRQAGRAHQGQGRQLPRARRGAAVHARWPRTSRRDFESFSRDVQPVPGDRELVLRRQRATSASCSPATTRAHARGADVDLPYNGDGSGDWQGFDAADYTYRHIPLTRRPRAVDTDASRSSSAGTRRRRRAGARARPSGATARSTTPSCCTTACAPSSRRAAARPT